MVRRSLSLCTALALLLPSFASARIWPDDFLVPTMNPIGETAPEPTDAPVWTPTPTIEKEDMPAVPTTIGTGLVTRIEFVAALVSRSAMQSTLDTCFDELGVGEFSLLFTDVGIDHPHAKELCVAMQRGLVRGYGDGSFHPNAPMNTAEASVIINRMANLRPSMPMAWEAWYAPAVRMAGGSVTGLPKDGRTLISGAMLKTMLCSIAEGLTEITAEPELQCTK